MNDDTEKHEQIEQKTQMLQEAEENIQHLENLVNETSIISYDPVSKPIIDS